MKRGLTRYLSTRIVTPLWTILAVGMLTSISAARGAGLERGNLCYNGSFDAPTNALAGWTTDYSWTGNTFYMQNHTRVSVLPSYEGKRSVLFINGAKETKAESKPIPFEKGARYRCTMDVRATGSPHVYFAGYKWQPGIRPYDDPHLGDLRNIYRSERQRLSPGPWRRISFEFPLRNASELALKHLSELRFFTVYIISVDGGGGDVYVDNVEVTRIQ